MSSGNPVKIGDESLESNDPWKKSTIRWEPGHNAEDSRLCLPTQTTQEIIEAFLLHDRRLLNTQIPGRWQVLSEFLYTIVPPTQSEKTTYVEDIERYRTTNDIAILDDRMKHECARDIGKHCENCPTFSESVDVVALHRRLQEEVSILSRNIVTVQTDPNSGYP